MNTSSILNEDSLTTTLLPFLSTLTAAKVFFVICAMIIVCLVVRFIVFRKSLTLHRAPTCVIFSYIITSLANMFISVMFYWYWALGLCAVMSVLFMFTTRGEVKDANSEERTGVWGLNPDIRRIRGELFNDMTPEQQLEYKKSVVPYRFNIPLFLAVTLAVPVLFMFLCKFSGLGYLFFPVEI